MIQQQLAETNHGVIASEPSPAALDGPSIGASEHETSAVPIYGDIGPLLRRVAKNPTALAELYRLTCGMLFFVALLILKRRDLAEHVLQLSYASICRDAARFDGSRDLPIDWMIAVVRKLAISHLRKANMDLIPLRDGFAQVKSTAIPQVGPDKVSLPGESQPEHGLILATAYLNGEDREQLSQRFGLPVEAVKALLRKSLLELHRVRE